MTKVNILTQGLISYNGIAFLSPLILNHKEFKNQGLSINFFTKISKKITECDILILESKFFVPYWKEPNHLFSTLQSLKKNNQLYFFDLGDSSSSFVLGVLPYVDRLYKSYLFKDKNLYTKSFYGGRIWSDYYYQNMNVIDEGKNHTPLFYASQKDLDKIHLSYGAAFGNYSLDCIFWHDSMTAKLAKRLWFLRKWSVQKTRLSAFIDIQNSSKTKSLFMRMSIDSYTNTIGYQRKKTSEYLSKYNAPSKKLMRDEYMQELANSKVVISPFGWGEINAGRDYEAALSGNILLKPRLDHVQTWPNIFNSQTIVQYEWDFSNLEEKVEVILNHYEDYLDYAKNLQKTYKFFVATNEGQQHFHSYFRDILQ